MTKQGTAILDENGRALITEEQARKGNTTLLASFGSRKELDEMMDRIMRVLTVFDPTMGPLKESGYPEGMTRKLYQKEALQMASVALAHGLDPFTSEIYPLVDKRSGFKVGIGRDAWSKALAYRLIAEGGGHAWPQFRQITDPDERSILAQGSPAGAIIYECKLYDSRSAESVTELIKSLTSAGAPWSDIKKIAGEPFTAGIGWYAPKSFTKSNDESFPPHERAKKRAYCAAVKLRAHLPFNVNDGSDDLPDDYSGPKMPEQSAASAATVNSAASSTASTASSATSEAQSAEQRARDAAAVFGDGQETASSVEHVATDGSTDGAPAEQSAAKEKSALEIQRERYSKLFKRATDLKLKPKSFTMNTTAPALQGMADTLEAEIKKAEGA